MALEARALLASYGGQTSGFFDKPDGGTVTGVGTSHFTWGEGANSPPNSFDFNGAAFSVNQEEIFSLGTITYFNGTTYNGTTANSVALEVPITLTSPAGTTGQTFTYPLNMVSTTNIGNVLADRDYVFLTLPSTPFQTFTTANGNTITLQILGFGAVTGSGGVNNAETIGQFLVEEGASASAQLLGRFVNPPGDPPDISIASMSISGNLQDVDVIYDITGQNIPSASSISFYWASGSAFGDRLSSRPIMSIATDTRSSPDSYKIAAPLSQFGAKPVNATHIIAVADSPDLANGNPNGAIKESNEGNNVASVGAPAIADFTAALFEENAVSIDGPAYSNGNLEVTYFTGGDPIPNGRNGTIDVYWATGSTKNDIIGGLNPIASGALDTSAGVHVFSLKISALANPPAAARSLIAVLNPTGSILETNKDDNFIAFEKLTPSNVSYELTGIFGSAPSAPTRYERVRLWLKMYSGNIDRAAREFNIDARAIAGAIAWEALQNVKLNPGYGPGKVHPFEFGKPAAAELVENNPRYTPVLPAQNKLTRGLILSTPGGAIRYIAAIMNAYSVEVQAAGFANVRNQPDILTTFYNGSPIHLESAAADLSAKRARGETSFGYNDTMGQWVANNLDFLDSAL